MISPNPTKQFLGLKEPTVFILESVKVYYKHKVFPSLPISKYTTFTLFFLSFNSFMTVGTVSIKINKTKSLLQRNVKSIKKDLGTDNHNSM